MTFERILRSGTYLPDNNHEAYRHWSSISKYIVQCMLPQREMLQYFVQYISHWLAVGGLCDTLYEVLYCTVPSWHGKEAQGA